MKLVLSLVAWTLFALAALYVLGPDTSRPLPKPKPPPSHAGGHASASAPCPVQERLAAEVWAA